MNIEITLKPLNVFEVVHASRSLGFFTLVGEWNGMAELRDRSTGDLLVVNRDDTTIDKFFQHLFPAKTENVEKVIVMKASSSVLHRIRTHGMDSSQPKSTADEAINFAAKGGGS